MACNTPIGSIEKGCGSRAAPGIKGKLYAARQAEITAIPDPDADTHVISDPITMRASAVGPPAVSAGVFSEWYASSREQSFQSVQNEETGLWETTVQIFIPKTEAEKSYILNNLGDEATILLVPDKEGNHRLVGSLDEPAQVTVTEQLTPTNGYIVSAKWTSSKSPYFYTGTITT